MKNDNSDISKDDLEEKLRQMKKLIDEQRNIQKELHNNLEKTQSAQKQLSESKPYPSHEVLYNPPISNQIPLTFADQRELPENDEILASSQFIPSKQEEVFTPTKYQ